MKSNIFTAFKIHNNSLSDESISLSELSTRLSKELNESGLLFKGYFKKKNVESTGTFDDQIWVLARHYKSTYAYIDFRKLEELTFINVSKKQVTLIKCWIAKLILDKKFHIDNEFDVSMSNVKTDVTIITKFNRFIDFLQISNNCDEKFLDLNKGDELRYYFTKLSLDLNDNNLNSAITFLLSYFRFSFIQNNIIDKIHSYEFYSQYIERLELLSEEMSGFTVSKNYDDENYNHLPNSTDILKFNYYMNIFFSDKNIDEDIKMYYYPLLIWWKITLIIPMRSNEISGKVPRNCISIEEGNYYLTIGRSKEKKVKKGSLPLITKFKITKDIYDLISLYIEKTNEYGSTKTLFSYNAYLQFRKNISIKYPTLFPLAGTDRDVAGMFSKNIVAEEDKQLFKNIDFNLDSNKKFTSNKIDEDRFSSNQLNTLLNSFYNKIIETYYEEISILEKIRINQTRHLAFSYLVLQGIPRVEIALMGGHRDTETIDTYSYDNNVYIDTQVKINVNKKLQNYTYSEETLYDKVMSMPKKSPIPIENCVETEFDNIFLGFCTTNENTACESFVCYRCSKWYCEPTFDNFKTLFDIVRKEIQSNNDTLQNNVKLINKLFENSVILNSNNEEISFDKDYFQDMQRLGNKIKCAADKIIKTKTEMLESMLEKGVEYSELEIIDKLTLLNETFNKDTVLIK